MRKFTKERKREILLYIATELSFMGYSSKVSPSKWSIMAHNRFSDTTVRIKSLNVVQVKSSVPDITCTWRIKNYQGSKLRNDDVNRMLNLVEEFHRKR